MPERVQLSRRKGWTMPPNTVKVDRSTKWGNPFRPDGDGPDCGPVEYAARKFGYMLGGYMCLCAKPSVKDQEAYLAMAKRDIAELFGKNLACWCKPGTACHADILLEIAHKKSSTGTKS